MTAGRDATAPLCSPSRGSLFAGRYPQSNGLVGLAQTAGSTAGVRTLPHILFESGWYTALFGMQHETSYPSKLGFAEFDVSNSYCEYVVEHATRWLADPPEQPRAKREVRHRSRPWIAAMHTLRSWTGCCRSRTASTPTAASCCLLGSR